MVSLSNQDYSLRWNNHPVNLVSVFTGLYQAESLVDVTLAAGGRHLQAHKVVLVACSEYFQSVFAANPCQHPVVILKDVAFDDLETVVKFMYHGIVTVSSDKLPAVLNTADALQIKGLEKAVVENLLAVPGPGRQPSTESCGSEFLTRSRSDAGYYPHRAHSADTGRGLSFELAGRSKRVLTPPPSPGQTSTARKKFRQRSEQSVEVGPEPGEQARQAAAVPTYHSLDTEHIAKKKRAMFQANKGSSSYGSRGSELHNSSEPVSESGRLQSQSSSSLGEEAGEQQSGLAATRNIVRSASAEDPAQQGALTTKFKRERFLKRQQCQEAAEESEVSSPASTSLPIATPVTTAPPPTPAVVLSEPLVSPAEKKVEQGEDAELEPKEEPAETGGGGGRRQLSLEPGQPATPRQPSLDPLCGLESVPLLYSSSGPRPPTSNLFRPVLPTVRITPDQEGELEPALAPSPLYPAHSPGLLHPDTGPGTWDCGPRPPPVHLEISAPPYHAPHPSYPPYCGPDTGYGRATLSQPRQFEPSRPELQTKPAAGQFGHCPKARDGPALSCNFCWNTTDGSGRILRRKTKYHCPECQTNLCIVPCFQQYHEAMENENTEMR